MGIAWKRDVRPESAGGALRERRPPHFRPSDGVFGNNSLDFRITRSQETWGQLGAKTRAF